MKKVPESVNWRTLALSPPGRRCASLSPKTSCVAAVRYLSARSTSGASLAARVASASVASACARNVWTSRAVIVRLRIASLRDLLHTPHFPGGESDLDAARVEGGCREDVFHNATSKLPGAL